MIGSMVAGRFQLMEEAGSDAVFDGFKARDRSAGKDVFVRVARSRGAGASDFASELQVVVGSLKGVSHGGLERVLGVYTEGGRVSVVSDYTPGSTLEARLKRLASVTVPVAVATGIELAGALSALHGAGLVHGDVSARAVLSTSSEGTKLLTPGFWRAYGRDPESAVGSHKQMAAYLAPEVTSGSMPSVQSDIYSLGVLLWQMLAGRLPYSAESPAGLAAKHANEAYPSLRAIVASVPAPLDEIIKKAMDKNPLRRYASAGEMLSDLKAVQDALRFGRKLKWPIAGPVSVEELSAVAPELNAVDPEAGAEATACAVDPKKAKVKKRREQTDGVPVWLAALTYIVTAMALLVVGGWLFFNTQQPKVLTVPNIVGLQVEEARKELQDMRLKLRESRRQVSDKFPEGAIIETDPAPGADIKEGTFLEAVVSKGSRFVEVPDFRGRTVEEARGLARSLNLEIVDTDIELVRDREAEAGRVVGQVPEARRKVERFTRMRLRVSNGNVRTGTDRSAVRQSNRVQFEVPGTLEADVLVRVDVTDDDGTRTLFEQLMAPGDKVDERVRWTGTELIIRIFFDGELIQQKTAKPEEGGE